MNLRTVSSMGLLLALAAFMSADDTPTHASPDGYAYAVMTCLNGSDGPGVLLRLSPYRGCEHPTYPYLEIHIQEQATPIFKNLHTTEAISALKTDPEQAILINQKLPIGKTISAFRCLKANSACEWFTSGEIMFNRFEQADKKGMPWSSGWYQLKFASGMPETGRFTTGCIPPCG
jgi:hypothetical protein